MTFPLLLLKLMPNQPPQEHPHHTQQLTLLCILQINLNKSEKAHLELINSVKSKDWDIVLVQEPHNIGHFNTIQSSTNFHSIFSEDRGRNDKHIHSLIWVSVALETRSWKSIELPGTNNIAIIQLEGDYGKLMIVNLYNDCTGPNTEIALSAFLRNNSDTLLTENLNMIWGGASTGITHFRTEMKTCTYSLLR